MRTLSALIFSLVVTISVHSSTSAQQLLKCAGVTYRIPAFRNDTLNGNTPLKKYLGSIHQSKYDLEIRCTVLSIANIMRTPVVIIKGNKDSLFAESYLFNFKDRHTQSDSLTGPKPHSPQIIYKRLTRTKYVDSVFRLLITNNVFAMKDHQIIEDSLKAHKVPSDTPKAMLDGPPSYMIEIKLHNQYHSYFIRESLTHFHTVVKEFVTADALKDVFRDLYEEVEKIR